jgi:hypothetical protein
MGDTDEARPTSGAYGPCYRRRCRLRVIGGTSSEGGGRAIDHHRPRPRTTRRRAAERINAEATATFDPTDPVKIAAFLGGLPTPVDHIVLRKALDRLVAPLQVARFAAGDMRAGGSVTFGGGVAARRIRVEALRTQRGLNRRSFRRDAAQYDIKNALEDGT